MGKNFVARRRLPHEQTEAAPKCRIASVRVDETSRSAPSGISTPCSATRSRIHPKTDRPLLTGTMGERLPASSWGRGGMSTQDLQNVNAKSRALTCGRRRKGTVSVSRLALGTDPAWTHQNIRPSFESTSRSGFMAPVSRGRGRQRPGAEGGGLRRRPGCRVARTKSARSPGPCGYGRLCRRQ
jgi:hypothetical protein